MTKMCSRIFLCVILLFMYTNKIVSQKTLPHYITPCKKSDPDLNKCAFEHALIAVKSILNGDKEYKVPKLNLFKLPYVKINSGSNIKLELTNLSVHGLENIVLQEIIVNLDKKYMIMKVDLDRIQFLGQYNIEGKILFLPIEGKGDCEFIFDGGSYTYKINWILIKKNGLDYMHIANSDFDYTLSNGHFRLENLFNGDQNLGDHMNTFLNENWRDVVKEVGDAVVGTVETIGCDIVSKYMSIVPYDAVFVD